MTTNRSTLLWACLCAAAVLLWQSLTVRYNYQGNWTALFCTGEQNRVPPTLAAEHIYQFANSAGYDGQFYHYVAHDPLLRHGMEAYIDAPRLRWRRILVPALAWAAAGGRAEWIDPAFRGVALAFVLLGAWWLSRCLVSRGRHPAWGLSFALTPAVLVSMDRMTVDVALAALTVAFVLYAVEEPSWRIYPVLVLAPLVRETGILLTGAFFLTMVWKRRWRSAAAAAGTALPVLAWTAFIVRHTSGHLATPVDYWPLHTLILRTLYPLRYAWPARWMMVAAAGDYVAVVGIWIALIGTVWLLVKHPPGPLEMGAGVFALLAVFLVFPAAWDEAYAFGRIFTPLLIFLGLAGVACKAWWLLAPALLMLPRIGMQLSGQLLGIAAGLLR